MNRVTLIGRLTRDPEIRTTASGKTVASFSIAVTKRIKPKDGSHDADFFNVSVWGSSADYVEKYLSKGRLVAVDGRLEQRTWADKSTGEKREGVQVVADNVQGLDRPTEAVRGNDEGEPYDPFAEE